MRDAWLRSSPLGLGLAGAAALWLAFPNGWISLPPLALLLPLCLALLGDSAPSAGAALRRGWLSSIVGMAAVLYWLTIPMATVGNLPMALAAVCAVLVATCLASAGGLFSLLAHALRGRGPLAQAWLLGLAWYFLEYVYALVAGFPWLPLGGALAAWPLWIQAADVTGAYLLAGLWVTVILSLRHWRRPACVCTGLLLAAMLLGYGAWRLHTTPLEDDPRGEDSVAVLFAEGNIDQNQKWVPAYQRRTVETYLRLTQAELARHPGEKPLIVWPETALPFNFDNNGILSALVRNLARQSQSPLLTGVPGFQYDAAGNMQVFNRALLLDPSGNTAGHYDKEHLVPTCSRKWASTPPAAPPRPWCTKTSAWACSSATRPSSPGWRRPAWSTAPTCWWTSATTAGSAARRRRSSICTSPPCAPWNRGAGCCGAPIPASPPSSTPAAA